MNSHRCLGILIIALTTAFAAGGCAPQQTRKTGEKVSRPFEYSGYSAPEYEGFVKRSEYVTMSDGVRIAVDIFIPAEGPPRDAFPVTLEYTPYSRAFVLPRPKWWQRLATKILVGTSGPVIDYTDVFGTGKLLLSHGYVYVVADMRGTGASYGWKMDFMPQLAVDGGEIVDWISKQTWCDGNVGMFGPSYLGHSQLITASRKHPALKCIFPQVVPLDGYTGEVYPGGIYSDGFMTNYSTRLDYMNLNYFLMDIPQILKTGNPLALREFSIPSAPVIDEDGDGRYHDEIPIDLNRNGTFLDDYGYPDDTSDPPRYKDGFEREHIYYLATKEHEQNMGYHSWASKGMFIDGIGPKAFAGVTAYDLSPSGHVPAIMETDIAIYNHGGWFDPFVRGTTELYNTMKGTNPSKLVIDAGYHPATGPFWDYLGEKEKRILAMHDVERLRFFDRYLRGIENGIDREPPVTIYVMNGDGWRSEQEWPLARQVMTDFHLGDGNALYETSGEAGTDSYRADFTHSTGYGENNANRWMAAMEFVPTVLPFRNDRDEKCLVYETAPLNDDREVTGHPIVHLFVSSTASHGDFFVYLVDVDTDGLALLVTEGMLRAGFAPLYDNDEMILSGETGIDVLPDLPWHGYERDQYVDGILADGKVVELAFDLLPTSWVFREGHRIRLVVACADWPTFRLHPKLSPGNHPDGADNIVPTITVFRDAEHPSRIELPVIPDE